MNISGLREVFCWRGERLKTWSSVANIFLLQFFLMWQSSFPDKWKLVNEMCGMVILHQLGKKTSGKPTFCIFTKFIIRAFHNFNLGCRVVAKKENYQATNQQRCSLFSLGFFLSRKKVFVFVENRRLRNWKRESRASWLPLLVVVLYLFSTFRSYISTDSLKASPS